MNGGRRLVTSLLIGWLSAGCVAGPPVASPTVSAMTADTSAQPTTVPSTSAATITPALGAALPKVDRPDAETCDRLQRGDLLAARNMRTGVDLSITGLEAAEAAVQAAAADPTADIALLGIPLRAAEVAALRDSGMYLDAAGPLLSWVNAGRTDLFGGAWVDPPGSRRYVVSVVDGVRATLDLARCLERDGLDVRYVMATHSIETLRAVQDRINQDWRALEAEGINIVSTGHRSTTNRLNVEIEGLTDEIAQTMIERYGDAILLEGVPVPTPEVPLALPDVPFAMGAGQLFGEPNSGGRQGPMGGWELLEGRLTDDELRLRVAIEPAPYDLPVTSGPAVLFAGMEVYGGAGDVGLTEPMDALATVALPACGDAACRYVAEVVLPAGEVLPAVRRLEARSDEITWVTVNLTLVRTFAAGTWLQVVPLDGPDGGGLSSLAGRLGAIEPLRATVFPYGLFPADQATPIPRGGGWMFTTAFDWPRAVERIRREVGDPTRALRMATGSLDVTIDPTCEQAAGLTLHDDSGNVAFDAEAFDVRSIEGEFAIPAGTTWRLTLHDGGGIDFDQGRAGWGIRVGAIRSDGGSIAVKARFDCGAGSGSVEVDSDP